MNQPWYKNAYRRHLCDMHINDTSPEYLSRFSAEEYAENILAAGFNEAMIYLQSHIGLCNFPTKVGTMHSAFSGREDEMNKLITLLRSKGVAVVGYYSLVFNTVEHDKHPDWRLIKDDGRSRREAKDAFAEETRKTFAINQMTLLRYGLCCPNNPDYRAFTLAQIAEIAAFTTVDGMFYDMTYWPHCCYCEHCKKRWRTEVGGEMPVRPTVGSDDWRRLQRKRTEWIGEFAALITSETKRVMGEHVTVEHNVAYSALNAVDTCNGIGVNAACDYSGGDLHPTPYIQSFACKFFRSISNHQPFEFMITRCDPSLFKHTTLKSHDAMASAVMLTAANHGATLVIDAIDPRGTLDARVYRHIGDVFEEQKPYEPYFEGTPLADVGLYYSPDSRYNKYNCTYNNYTSVTGLIEALIKRHILPDVTGVYDKRGLSRFRMLFAPLLTCDDEADNARLTDYVRNGGILYLSGADNPKLTEALLDCRVKGVTDEIITFLSPTEKGADIFEYFTADYPLAVDSPAAVLEGLTDAEVLATLTKPYTKQYDFDFASIHSNPPGIRTDLPALVVKPFGKGKVIFSALPFESDTVEISGIICANLADKLLGKKTLCRTEASPRVELTAYETDECFYVNAVHLTTDTVAETVSAFDVSFRCERKPSRVELLPDGKNVPFAFADGYVTFTAESMKLFNMYRILK